MVKFDSSAVTLGIDALAKQSYMYQTPKEQINLSAGISGQGVGSVFLEGQTQSKASGRTRSQDGVQFDGSLDTQIFGEVAYEEGPHRVAASVEASQYLDVKNVQESSMENISQGKGMSFVTNTVDVGTKYSYIDENRELIINSGVLLSSITDTRYIGVTYADQKNTFSAQYRRPERTVTYVPHGTEAIDLQYNRRLGRGFSLSVAGSYDEVTGSSLYTGIEYLFNSNR